MKVLFVAVVIIFCVKISAAQSAYLDYNGEKSVSNFLRKKIRPMPIIMENCQMPFTYVKFKVTDKNTVDSLTVTNSSFPDVSNEIVRVMGLTNGFWNIEQAKDKWLIVPVIFYTEYNKNKRGEGCDFKKILADQNKEMAYANNEANAVYFPLVRIYSEWGN